IGIRQRILELAAEGTLLAQREKERLLFDAEDALDRVRLIGDLVIGAFFGQSKDKDRQKERDRRLALVEQWLTADKAGDGAKAAEIEADLRGMQADLKKTQVPFHWMVEFPEVFYAERPDPLEHNLANGAAFVEAFVGNPPFAGKNAITISSGERYIDWLMSARPEVQGHPNTDLCAYFFRRAADLLGEHGSMGFVATNTIAQGDTRSLGVKPLVAAGAIIYDARATFPWPGDAAVSISTLHLAFGCVRGGIGHPALDGKRVTEINSRLLAGAERPDPVGLTANANLSFMGIKLVGIGLAVSLEEFAQLVKADSRNRDVMRPYIGGEDVNSDPEQNFQRYMIDFTSMSLDEARQYPLLMSIIEEKVRPTREKDKRGTYKTYWWRPGESGGALYSSLTGLQKCLVCARVTKHLCFSFQPATRGFNDKLYVFPLDRHSAFAVLQSRVHIPWAWLLSSTMKTDLNYTASECFETFPFPRPDPRAVVPDLEAFGERLYDERARFMVDRNQGLTKTYNALKDSSNEDPRILELRTLHEEMDRAVLDAYGWGDIAVPPYCPLNEDDRAAIQAFEDEVIDRLFVLNAQRAEEEKAAAALQPTPSKRKNARTKKPPPSSSNGPQLALPGGKREEEAD
ncbi:MAG: hypothetical protein CVU63_00365, partial [Deltaproteobacteria bacterium HGW-Deltaproteobacteria-20]